MVGNYFSYLCRAKYIDNVINGPNGKRIHDLFESALALAMLFSIMLFLILVSTTATMNVETA